MTTFLKSYDYFEEQKVNALKTSMAAVNIFTSEFIFPNVCLIFFSTDVFVFNERSTKIIFYLDWYFSEIKNSTQT